MLFSRMGDGKAGGTAGLAAFLYLEMLDASFSLDGVLGAFAITTDLVLVALGLGVGAIFVRSMTVYVVREEALGEYRYLKHGAHWAVAALAVILYASIEVHVPEWVTGTIGISAIVAALVSSVIDKRRARRDVEEARRESRRRTALAYRGAGARPVPPERVRQTRGGD